MKITVLTRHDLSTSYSCILYLKETLEKYAEVSLWSFTPPENIDTRFKKNSKSFLSYPVYKDINKKLNRFKEALSMFHAILISLKSDTIIVNDMEFILSVYIAKKIKKNLKVIHYNTELYGGSVPCSVFLMKFYEKHASFPDLILECLPERAAYRKKLYKIDKPVFCINNTLPSYLAKQYISSEYKTESYVDFKVKKPILVYAGGTDKTRGLAKILESLEYISDKINVLMFCSGSENDINDIKNQCKKPISSDCCRVYKAVERKKLLNIMRRCDIGLNYYDPDIDANNKYSSPTKFYEYMAVGLKTLSSDNEGINHIIENEKIGVCMHKGETLAAAIDRMLNSNLKSKDEISKLFFEKYCYENDAKEAIEQIIHTANN